MECCFLFFNEQPPLSTLVFSISLCQNQNSFLRKWVFWASINLTCQLRIILELLVSRIGSSYMAVHTRSLSLFEHPDKCFCQHLRSSLPVHLISLKHTNLHHPPPYLCHQIQWGQSREPRSAALSLMTLVFIHPSKPVCSPFSFLIALINLLHQPWKSALNPLRPVVALLPLSEVKHFQTHFISSDCGQQYHRLCFNTLPFICLRSN